MIFLSDLIRFSAVCLLSYLHGIRSRTCPNLNNLKLSILLWNLLSAVVSELQYMWRTVILTLWELTIVSYGDSSSQCLPLRGERRVSTCFCLLLVYFVHFSNERPTSVPQWTAITSRVKDFTSANGQGGGGGRLVTMWSWPWAVVRLELTTRVQSLRWEYPHGHTHNLGGVIKLIS